MGRCSELGNWADGEGLACSVVCAGPLDWSEGVDETA